MVAILLSVAQFFVFLAFGIMLLVGVLQAIFDLMPPKNKYVN